MKAVVQESYGAPDRVLRVREIDEPIAGDDEVLVRVRAATVHPDVWHVVTGWPYVLRLMGAGLRGPKNPVPGTDVAGIVESVGAAVTRFAAGDEVFGETLPGMQWKNGGAYAEYVAAPEASLAARPAGVPFEHAASVAASGYIAFANLRPDELEPGQSVLVNGAAGNVGSIALQLAKGRGARVTGVDRTDKLDLMRSLGADEVIDYTVDEVLGPGERYDRIFDVASNLSLSACKGSLTDDGVYVLIGHDHYGDATGRVFGSLPRFMGQMAVAPFTRHLPKMQSMPPKGPVMNALAEALESGTLTPVIDSTFSLDQVVEAMRRLQSGQARGRILMVP